MCTVPEQVTIVIREGTFNLCANSYQSKEGQEPYVIHMYCLTYAGHDTYHVLYADLNYAK